MAESSRSEHPRARGALAVSILEIIVFNADTVRRPRHLSLPLRLFSLNPPPFPVLVSRKPDQPDGNETSVFPKSFCAPTSENESKFRVLNPRSKRVVVLPHSRESRGAWARVRVRARPWVCPRDPQVAPPLCSASARLAGSSIMDLSPSLLVLLPLLGWCGAQHILPEGPVDVLLGGNATLATLLDKPEYQFIIWNFNNGDEQVHVATLTRSDLKVNEPYRDRVAIDGATGNLFLKETKSADSGDYGITVITMTGDTRTAEIELRVLEPVSEVTIRSDLPEAIEHNSTVVLTCSAKGSFLRFSWANGTKTLVPDGKRITLKEEQRTSTMTIAGVLRWDLRGPISCLASNGLESMRSAPFNLTVYYGPELVALAPPTPPPFIKTGSDFNLTCSAVSSPDATFQWFRDQQPMEASGSVLTLKALQEHGGASATAQYRCGATNSKTRRTLASTPVSFAVIGPILGVNLSGPSGVLFAGNGSANLSCWVEAGEVTTTTWRKDGRALSAGGRVLFAADMRSIRMEPLQKEDNGRFVCELSNQVDRQEASYQMVVNYGPEEPTVTGEKAVEVNQRVTLTCSAPSVPPANFTWKVNGSATGVNTATFVIDKAAYKNTGTYTCEAHNTVTGGRGQVTHFLAVKEEGSLEGLSGGAIAGIVIAVLVAVGVAIGLFLYCRQVVPVESPY